MASFDTTEETLISQYAAPQVVIPAIIDSWAAATVATMEGAFSSFLSDYWDINSAIDGGLDNWGQILGVSRYITLPNSGAFFGFADSDNDFAPLGQAPFYLSGSLSNTYALSDDAYRVLLLAKARANISGSSIQALNQLCQSVFGEGAMYVADTGNMTMEYVFATTPTALQLAIAEGSGVLPHPTGVGTTVFIAILSNGQLIAGTSGSDIGYGSGFGSLTPAIDNNGNDVTALYSDSGSLVLQITSTSGADLETQSSLGLATQSWDQLVTEGPSLTSSYFTYLLIDGIVLKATSATFSSSGNVYTWTWTGAPLALINGKTYTVLVM